jgi:hypothetical protein
VIDTRSIVRSRQVKHFGDRIRLKGLYRFAVPLIAEIAKEAEDAEKMCPFSARF